MAVFGKIYSFPNDYRVQRVSVFPGSLPSPSLSPLSYRPPRNNKKSLAC